MASSPAGKNKRPRTIEHELIVDGWFHEKNSQWPGQANSLEVQEILFSERSDYQDVLVFESNTWGTVLVLDGVIQVSTRDEYVYQEMITQVPMCAHGNAKHVLVIGGGDGGAVREILKHPGVSHVTMCEIDKMVPEVSKKYMPQLCPHGFNDPRLTLHIGDGIKFMDEHKASFDVIITDSSDPVGPAHVLFEEPYYRKMHAALKPGGVVCTQAENMFLNLDLISGMVKFSKTLYNSVKYCTAYTPTYPSGQIGFLLCSKGDTCPSQPKATLDMDKYDLKYYSEEIHKSSFVLPAGVMRAVYNPDSTAGSSH